MSDALFTGNGLFQLAFYIGVLVLLAKPLGTYMANIYTGTGTAADPAFLPLENGFYRLCGIDPHEEMGWKKYALCVIGFSLAGWLLLYGILRLQTILPLNPAGLGEISQHLSFNTAVSFITNTNWQSYGGESTMSYFSQMAGLAVQNFLSAAMGMAVLVAMIRGFTRKNMTSIGNFWVDLTRGTFHILLPLSLLLALLLISQGVVQSFSPYVSAELIEPFAGADNAQVTQQSIAVGPAASQIAIKQLGTNGGGFFNVNSAHPLENPTPLSNFLEVMSILLIPAALCYSFGKMVGDTRQGWAVLIAMLIIFIPLLFGAVMAEQNGNPKFASWGIDQSAGDAQAGGNMEGKETRFGIVNSALWASATTAASNGSVNSMHASFTPLGGMIPMIFMQFGEVIFGGVGSGLYGMLMLVIITVFIAGLMVGRTPEYLGKKLGAFEMKMASVAILVPCMAVLVGSAVAVMTEAGRAGLLNPGAQGFSEVLYAFTSAGNNNGSAFAGLTANSPFYDTALGLAMLFGRFFPMLPALAIAGALAAKNTVPASSGTLPTHTPLFIFLLVAVVLLVALLTYIPALALGPVAEHFFLMGK